MPNREKNEIIIFGSAETAELAKYYFDNDSIFKVVAFTVDDPYVNSTSFCGLPLIPFSEVVKNYPPSEYLFFAPMAPKKMNALRKMVYFEANFETPRQTGANPTQDVQNHRFSTNSMPKSQPQTVLSECSLFSSQHLWRI
jgi:hypothetical protein